MFFAIVNVIILFVFSIKINCDVLSEPKQIEFYPCLLEFAVRGSSNDSYKIFKVKDFAVNNLCDASISFICNLSGSTDKLYIYEILDDEEKKKVLYDKIKYELENVFISSKLLDSFKNKGFLEFNDFKNLQNTLTIGNPAAVVFSNYCNYCSDFIFDIYEFSNKENNHYLYKTRNVRKNYKYFNILSEYMNNGVFTNLSSYKKIIDEYLRKHKNECKDKQFVTIIILLHYGVTINDSGEVDLVKLEKPIINVTRDKENVKKKNKKKKVKSLNFGTIKKTEFIIGSEVNNNSCFKEYKELDFIAEDEKKMKNGGYKKAIPLRKRMVNYDKVDDIVKVEYVTVDEFGNLHKGTNKGCVCCKCCTVR